MVVRLRGSGSRESRGKLQRVPVESPVVESGRVLKLIRTDFSTRHRARRPFCFDYVNSRTTSIVALDLSRADFDKVEEGKTTTDPPDTRSHCTRSIRPSVVLVHTRPDSVADAL